MIIEDVNKLKKEASANIFAVRNVLKDLHPANSETIHNDFGNIFKLISEQNSSDILASFKRVFALIDQSF